MTKFHNSMMWLSVALSISALCVSLAFVFRGPNSSGSISGHGKIAIAPDGSYAQFSSDAHDAPGLTFYDNQGRPRLELGISKVGTPFLFMLDDKGTQVAVINSVSRSGAPTLFLRSPAHPFRSLEITIDSDGKATVLEHSGASNQP